MGSYAAPWTSISPETRIAIRLDITYPSALLLVFTDIAVFDSAFGANTGNASTGMATAFSFGSFKLGGDGGDVTVALRNVKYIADQGATGSSFDAVAAYPDLASIVANYMFHGAAVTIKQYCIGPNGNSDSRELLDGKWTAVDGTACIGGAVNNVTSVTGNDITLEIALNLSMEKSLVPSLTVGTKERPTRGRKLPDGSKGLAIPMRMGLPYHIPPGWESFWSTSNAQWSDPWTYMFRYGSSQIGILPARCYAQQSGLGAADPAELMWTHCEEPTHGAIHAFDGTGAAPFKMYEYLSALESFGLVASSDLGVPTMDTAGGVEWYYNWTSRRRRNLSAMLIPKDIIWVSGSSVVNPEAAIDRKPDTYTTLKGNSAEVRYRIPNVGNLGTIRSDSGLQVFVITASNPPGADAVGAGNFQLGIKEPFEKPGGATWQFTPNYTYVVGSLNGYQAHIPPTTGWVGTQWQQWNFTASGSNATNDGNSRIYIAGAEGNPFDITVYKFGGATTDRLHIVAIGLLVGFIKDASNYQEWKRVGHIETRTMQNGKTVSFWQWDGYAAPPAPKTNAPKRHGSMWSREAKPDLRPYPEKEQPIDPEGVYGLMPGFYDPDDRFGGGIGWIAKPGSIIAFLAKYYSDPPTSFTIGLTTGNKKFGTVRTFNAIMDMWASYAAGAATTYKMHNWWTTDQFALGEDVNKILAECPGMPFWDLASGYPTSMASGRPALMPQYHKAVIGSVDDPYHNDYESLLHACATSGLEPLRDITMGTDRPALEVLCSPTREAICELEIHYQYDPARKTYGRIASVNAISSDDGYGSAWPTTPNGVAAETLCDTSRTMFGRSRKVVIHLQYIWDRYAAVAYGLSQLWLRWRPQWTVRFCGTLACQDIVPGHLISFNDSVTAAYGVRNPVPFRGANAGSWTGFYWRVTSVERAPGDEVYYNIMATEHYNSVPQPSGIIGGPVLTPLSEGFDQ